MNDANHETARRKSSRTDGAFEQLDILRAMAPDTIDLKLLPNRGYELILHLDGRQVGKVAIEIDADAEVSGAELRQLFSHFCVAAHPIILDSGEAVETATLRLRRQADIIRILQLAMKRVGLLGRQGFVVSTHFE